MGFLVQGLRGLEYIVFWEISVRDVLRFGAEGLEPRGLGCGASRWGSRA